MSERPTVAVGLHMSKKPVKEHEWRIARIKGSAATYVGRVTAPHMESAIKKAIAEFEITNPKHQKRLVTQRIWGNGRAPAIS